MPPLPPAHKEFKRKEVYTRKLRLTDSSGLPKGTIDDNGGEIRFTNSSGTAVTLSATELGLLDGLTGVPVQAALVSYTETTGAGTYTGAVTVPAGALILDIKVWSTVLWTATTSALMDVGDAADPDGWFTQIDLKATDLLVGEEINFENYGGKQGVYLVAATGLRSKAYSASARVITGSVVTVGAAGNAGRSFMSVVWVLPTASAAAKA